MIIYKQEYPRVDCCFVHTGTCPMQNVGLEELKARPLSCDSLGHPTPQAVKDEPDYCLDMARYMIEYGEIPGKEINPICDFDGQHRTCVAEHLRNLGVNI